jgi:valyl-tRNA synthetase
MEIPKTYGPKETENKIYNLWEKGDFFAPKGKGKPFVIVIPPPNITGSLHMGHALNNTIQDVLIRYHRMKQEPTLWIPGTDHAGIATQNKVEKELKKQGLSRHSLGREKFVEKVWEWKEKYGNEILNQLKKLGCSCDWSRLRFTLDKGYVKAVETAFLHYYKKGWIYRGPRIINWCPRCGTAISDIEIKYIPHKTKLWYIKYPLKNEKKFITVATTRPETMLGDTAVAVNPKDSRYKNLVGEKVILPLVSREIPIIADRLIDLEFGTGAVKITPAHDAIDNKIGKNHKLETINVIGEDGKITDKGGKYTGMKTLEAREKIIEDLKTLDLLEKEKDYEHSLAICDRCETPIEPLISKQWFMKMDEIKKPAIKAVKSGKIKFTPERYKKIYLDWMEKAEDWCISRQLWWGHKIPLKGEEDVLDTWFSSALWPFATFNGTGYYLFVGCENDIFRHGIYERNSIQRCLYPRHGFKYRRQKNE